MVMARPTTAPVQTFWKGGEIIKCDNSLGWVDNDPKSSESHSEFEEHSKAESSLIGAAHWVLLSNRIVSYWPISKRKFINGRKSLNFHQPTIAFFLSLLFIFFNIVHVARVLSNWSLEDKQAHYVDVILITILDSMVIVSVTIHRIYWLVRFPKFRLFWKSLVGVVAQITALSSEKETLAKFAGVRRWTLKFLIVFALVGGLDCGMVFYKFGFVSVKPLVDHFFCTYMETVICMHNSSALMLIFLIKVITYGFKVCREKVESLGGKLQRGELEGRRNIYFAPYHDDNHCGPREIGQQPSSILITQILELVDALENCVEGFNRLFGFSLFLETLLGFGQVLFAMYFLAYNDHWTEIVIMLVPLGMYTSCLVMVCVASSNLTEECSGMLASFQKLSSGILSGDENYKIQILVSRLSPSPPGIQVAQLFQIRQSLLGTTLNTIATYFIVLMQMKQAAVAVPSGSTSKDIITNNTNNDNGLNSGNTGTREVFGEFQFN